MKHIALVVLIVVLACVPAFSGGDYFTNVASQVLIAALFALSLNLLVGYAGLTSLGHAGYLGLSGYLSSWLVLNMQWSLFGAGAAALAL
ncbi:MAG: ABC transporter permease subunit, partial [Burkholderiaceae bacterium]